MTPARLDIEQIQPASLMEMGVEAVWHLWMYVIDEAKTAQGKSLSFGDW
jgi:hypothetical protein